MSLTNTPASDRVHIGFFGCTNAGKSSVVNAVTDQNLAVVSDIKGTTTDPVYKTMELLPLGPVMIIDTAGYDDEGALGKLRIKKTKQVLNKTDIAVLVVDATLPLSEYDNELIKIFKDKEINYIVAYNKCDLLNEEKQLNENEIYISATNKINIYELKEKIAYLSRTEEQKVIVGDLINPDDFIILVTPIDSSAPKGRLILPQQQTIRDILEVGASAIVMQEDQLKEALKGFSKKPTMVITDSQAFAKVSEDTPLDIPLTSFSILMARYKGLLDTSVEGVKKLDSIKDGDTILIAEGCTHHKQCDDLGTVKIPNWIKKYTNKDINFSFSVGTEFPEDLSPYALIIHCGGCMLNEREVKYRMKCANDQNIPITNYGITIAFMQGILKRSVEIFKHLRF